MSRQDRPNRQSPPWVLGRRDISSLRRQCRLGSPSDPNRTVLAPIDPPNRARARLSREIPPPEGEIRWSPAVLPLDMDLRNDIPSSTRARRAFPPDTPVYGHPQSICWLHSTSGDGRGPTGWGGGNLEHAHHRQAVHGSRLRRRLPRTDGGRTRLASRTCFAGSRADQISPSERGPLGSEFSDDPDVLRRGVHTAAAS